jgi:threonine/homoserine/homoserine lactone efflux protein
MLDRLLAFTLTAFIIVVIPGPSVLFVVGRALAFGRRTALLSVIGNEIGALLMASAVAFGIGSLVERSLIVFTVIKLAGAGYLIYLGIKAWRARKETMSIEPDQRTPGNLRAVRDGFLVGATNPKALVFLAAVLPQFVDRSAGHVPLQMFLCGAIFTVVALIFDSIWSLAASGARAWFSSSPRRLRVVGGTGGLAMIGLGLGIAFTGRKD